MNEQEIRNLLERISGEFKNAQTNKYYEAKIINIFKTLTPQERNQIINRAAEIHTFLPAIAEWIKIKKEITKPNYTTPPEEIQHYKQYQKEKETSEWKTIIKEIKQKLKGKENDNI